VNSRLPPKGQACWRDDAKNRQRARLFFDLPKKPNNSDPLTNRMAHSVTGTDINGSAPTLYFAGVTCTYVVAPGTGATCDPTAGPTEPVMCHPLASIDADGHRSQIVTSVLVTLLPSNRLMGVLMTITSIHVCFEVSDLSRAMAFYKPLFAAAGFERYMGDDTTYVGYKHGPFALVIGQEAKRRVTRLAPRGDEFVVTDHVGFSVKSVAEVEAIASAMQAANVKPLFPAQEYPEFGPGFFGVTFIDADNNVLEFGYSPRHS